MKKINLSKKKKIVCLTAYSKNMAMILDKYCDLILVGDSLANVLYAMNSTHSISLETMAMHAASVKKGVKKALLVVDMPKGSYKDLKSAKKNAAFLVKKSKCDGIKIENNGKNFNIIKGLVEAGFNVMGHIGFTPQYMNKFKVSGDSNRELKKLLSDAKKIENFGAFSIVLECIKTSTAKIITKNINIPTIGIGSSKYCDGQILVTDDLLGISRFNPKFVKKYLDMNKLVDNAVKKFTNDVKKGSFPKQINSF